MLKYYGHKSPKRRFRRPTSRYALSRQDWVTIRGGFWKKFETSMVRVGLPADLLHGVYKKRKKPRIETIVKKPIVRPRVVKKLPALLTRVGLSLVTPPLSLVKGTGLATDSLKIVAKKSMLAGPNYYRGIYTKAIVNSWLNRRVAKIGNPMGLVALGGLWKAVKKFNVRSRFWWFSKIKSTKSTTIFINVYSGRPRGRFSRFTDPLFSLADSFKIKPYTFFTQPEYWKQLNLDRKKSQYRVFLSSTSGLYNWHRLHRRWAKTWALYSKLMLRERFFKRKVWIDRGQIMVKWEAHRKRPNEEVSEYLRHIPFTLDNKFFGTQTFTVFNRTRYFNRLWTSIVRLKFERFFFKNSGVRTYIWMYNIWTFVRKHMPKWRRFEKSCMWRLTNYRHRFSLRRGLARVFLRTLGLFFAVSGTLHCFVHILTFLIRRFRRHWQLFKFIDGYLKLGRRYFLRRTRVGYRVIICGKFTGRMRARKHVFAAGTINYFLWDRKLDYVRADSFTKWGVFGISVWLQTRMFHKLTRKREDYDDKQLYRGLGKRRYKALKAAELIPPYKKKKQRIDQKFREQHPAIKFDY